MMKTCCPSCANGGACESACSDTHTHAGLITCQVLPWYPDRIASLVTTHLAVGHRDLDRLESTVLANLYARTREGVPIPWMALPHDCAPCLLELRRMLRAYLTFLLASASLAAAQQRYAAIGGLR